VKHLLFGRRRTFKNYIDNNSNQLRKLENQKKIQIMTEMENTEKELHDYIRTANINNI